MMAGDQYQCSQCLLFVVKKSGHKGQKKVTKSSRKRKSSRSSASAVPSTPKAFVVFSEAFEKKRPQVVELFKENGLDALSLENISTFLLGEDAKVELIELFLDECPSASLNPLTIIADCMKEDIIRRLFAHGTVCVEDKGIVNVRAAVDVPNFEVVEYLFTQKAGIHYRGGYDESLLHLAARHGPESLLSLILERGGDIDAQTYYGATALHLSAQYGFVGGVELLLMKGANIEAQMYDGYTPLHTATRYGHVRVITVLLDRGANIEAETSHKETPLLLAAAVRDEEALVSLLLERGANVQARDQSDRTCLHKAAQGGFVSMVELFLRHGVRVDAKDGDDETALHLASLGGDLDVVQTLLLNNADVNAKSEDGATPMYYAVEEENVEVVKVLIKFRAQVSVKDEEGESVLHPEYEYYHSICQYLLESCFLHPESLRESGIVAYHIKTMSDNPHLLKYSKFSDLCKIIAHHAVKICVLQSTDEFGELDPSPFWTDSATFSDYKIRCAEEVARLKLTTVGDTNMSFYEFLALDVPRVAKLFRNDSVAEITDSALQEMFPIFGSILSHHFDKGRELKSMMAECIKICKGLFGISFKKLPFELQEKILVDFNYKDLSCLIKACQRSNEASTPDPDN